MKNEWLRPQTRVCTISHPPRVGRLLCMASLCMLSLASFAKEYPITPEQRAKATQAAEKGVALSELNPNAPASYKVKSGDTLWAISGLFLKSPWRWPELWGVNMKDISNPHLIYPGQMLWLDTSSGRAVLRTSKPNADAGAIRVSPRTRSESLNDSAIAPIPMQLIEPFLSESMIVDGAEFDRAPRIVAAPEGRVMLTKGDRAYARGAYGTSLAHALSTSDPEGRRYRVFRSAKPLKDPISGQILGYEAQYVGKAELIRSEGTQQTTTADGKSTTEVIPATVDILGVKEEIRIGDRLIPEPERPFLSFVPHAPDVDASGHIVAVTGNAVTYAAQNQVVIINRGASQGLQPGNVLAILKATSKVADRTDADHKVTLALPAERNGLMMVFRTFDKLSYALIMQITEPAKVGDGFTNP